MRSQQRVQRGAPYILLDPRCHAEMTLRILGVLGSLVGTFCSFSCKPVASSSWTSSQPLVASASVGRGRRPSCAWGQQNREPAELTPRGRELGREAPRLQAGT